MANNRDNVYGNTNNRLIYLTGDIDEENIGKLNFILLDILRQDNEEDEKQKKYVRNPIHFHINSHGGYVDDMWSLIDIILSSKTPIYTYCTGYAMSAGFQIFLAGHKRFISKHVKLLYHQVSGCNWGKYMDMKQDIINIERDQKEIVKYILSRTKITKERIDEVVEKKINWYIYAEEAIKLGVADEII